MFQIAAECVFRLGYFIGDLEIQPVLGDKREEIFRDASKRKSERGREKMTVVVEVSKG